MSVAAGSWHYDWYVTLHNTKRQTQNYKLVPLSAKAELVPQPVGFQLALRMSASAKVHVSSLRGCQDKSRTGKLKEGNHLTAFNARFQKQILSAWLMKSRCHCF